MQRAFRAQYILQDSLYLGGRSHEAYSNRGVSQSFCHSVSQSVATISRSSLKQATRVEIDTCSDLNFQKFDFKA